MEVVVGIFPKGDNPKGYTIIFDDNATNEEVNDKMKKIVLSELNGRHGEADWATWQFKPRKIVGEIKI